MFTDHRFSGELMNFVGIHPDRHTSNEKEGELLSLQRDVHLLILG
jgi:hypothetical protein